MTGKLLSALMLLLSVQVQAAYECSVKPRNDVVLTPQTVQVTGAGENWLIRPDGSVSFNERQPEISPATRQKALAYQQALRRDLPWIDWHARQHLANVRVALDRVIVNNLGAESHVRDRLTALDTQLRQQMNRIIEHRQDGLAFHYQAVEPVRQESEQLIQRAMGGILQDSLNIAGQRRSDGGQNPLQLMMSNLGGLQKEMQQEWDQQEQDLRHFGHEVCQRVTTLESQRTELFAQIK